MWTKSRVVCVIVYCLLGLCGRAETRKDEEMAEKGSHVALETTMIQSDDEEQRKELYPNTVSIVINSAGEYEWNNKEITNRDCPHLEMQRYGQ